jgi:two-component system sensor histidine kinase KdpD
MRQRTWSRLILRTAIMGTSLTAVSALYHYTIRANSTTAALTYLLVVLGAATLWGLPEAAVASVFSMLCLDYYFLPPVPALGIDDPQNWVAWGAFLITSFVVSELSARLKRRAMEATQRTSEIERMYALSCSLMQASAAAALAQDIPGQVVEVFGCPGVAFFDTLSGQIYRAGIAAGISDAALIEAAGSVDLPRAAAGNRALVSVNLGPRTVGSLGFSEASISAPAMQSIANLVALAMDRARKQEAAAQSEGARRHHELKSMLLDALAHDFQTPLTSIRAGIDAMLAESPERDQREWLEIMDEESGRLSAMMTQAIQMARIEAGYVDLDRQTHTVEDLVYSALEKQMAAGSPIEVDLPHGLPPVSADAGLIRLVIREIAANALKYSQPGAPIRVRAHAADAGVVVSVIDRGPGIPAEEQRLIFEKYYRGKQTRGNLTGMGMGLPIARQVVEAHHGRVWVESQPGEGATFSFTLPFAYEEASV